MGGPLLILALIHPAASVALAAVVAAAVVWYWWRLGEADVPESRRRIRRTSLIVTLILLPVLVRALSYTSPASPVDFVTTWAAVALLVGLIGVFALVDVWNNLRLHREDAEQAAVESAAELMKHVRRQRRLRELRGEAGEGGEPDPADATDEDAGADEARS